MSETPEIFYGLDIGGTKIGVCVGDRDGRVLAQGALETDRESRPEELLDEACAQLAALRGELGAPGPAALGVAAPGPLDAGRGLLLEVPNMPRWQGFELAAHLRRRLELPLAVQNDANASVLAEWYWGSARGADTAVFLTMSTGMGAGLVVGGRLFEGPLGLAGEIGHLRLREDGPVGFGKRGSVEGYLSGPGMVQVAAAERLVFLQSGRETRLPADPARLTPELLCDLAREGDLAASAAVERSARELGRLCALLADLLNPDVIVLGTIGAAHPDLFLPTAERVVAREALPRSAAHLRLVPTTLEHRGHRAALAVARATRP